MCNCSAVFTTRLIGAVITCSAAEKSYDHSFSGDLMTMSHLSISNFYFNAVPIKRYRPGIKSLLFIRSIMIIRYQFIYYVFSVCWIVHIKYFYSIFTIFAFDYWLVAPESVNKVVSVVNRDYYLSRLCLIASLGHPVCFPANLLLTISHKSSIV